MSTYIHGECGHSVEVIGDKELGCETCLNQEEDYDPCICECNNHKGEDQDVCEECK